jgi:ferritin-like metal-binding protein YciE
MSLDSLHDLYVSELKDLYSAESQLLKALPRLAGAPAAPNSGRRSRSTWR